MTARTALTYRDYVALPEDGKRYEIHDGELCVMPSPTPLHQIALLNLAKVMDGHVRAHHLGQVMVAPLDVILSNRPNETTILQPDILFLDRQRLGLTGERAIEGAPTLVVEILSPSTAVIDRTRKRDLYGRYGVACLWFVDLQARALEAHVLRASQYTLVARVSGSEPVDLPPFVGLGLLPSSLWE